MLRKRTSVMVIMATFPELGTPPAKHFCIQQNLRAKEWSINCRAVALSSQNDAKELHWISLLEHKQPFGVPLHSSVRSSAVQKEARCSRGHSTQPSSLRIHLLGAIRDQADYGTGNKCGLMSHLVCAFFIVDATSYSFLVRITGHAGAIEKHRTLYKLGSRPATKGAGELRSAEGEGAADVLGPLCRLSAGDPG